jgi:hypothetical protein
MVGLIPVVSHRIRRPLRIRLIKLPRGALDNQHIGGWLTVVLREPLKQQAIAPVGRANADENRTGRVLQGTA